MKSEKWSVKTSTHAYTCTETCMHTLSLFHTHMHTNTNSYNWNKVSQINTGKVQYAHVISLKFNKTKGEITPDQNGKVCRSPLLYCSFTPSWLQKREKNRERKGKREGEREAPVLSSYSHLVRQEWLTPNTTGHRVLPSVASLLLTLHLCPAVVGGGGGREVRMGRGENRWDGSGLWVPFHDNSIGPVLDCRTRVGCLGSVLACVVAGRRYVCRDVEWAKDGPGTEGTDWRRGVWGMGVKKPIFFCRLIGPVSWARWALPWSPAGPQPLGAGCPSVWQASRKGRAYGGTAWSHTAERPWHHQSWVPPSTPETTKSRMSQWDWWDNIFVIFYLSYLEFIPLSDYLYTESNYCATHDILSHRTTIF